MVKDKLEDITLVRKIRHGNCSESFNELKVRHMAMFNKLLNKYYGALIAKRFSLEDVRGDVGYLFGKAVVSFDESKHIKFSTWLMHSINYHFLNLLNRKQDMNVYLEDDSVLDFLADESAIGDTTIKEYVFNILDQMHDKRVKRVFKLRYSDKRPLPWRVIGRDLSVSSQTAINLHNRGLRLIKSKILKKEHQDFV